MTCNCAILLFLLSAAAQAQEKVDAMSAQGQMHNRISALVERRARELGLTKDVITYCRVELNLHTEQLPKNGSIPFGVNYKQITDASELKVVIDTREAYEKTFLLLCLSRAKRDLSVDHSPPNKSSEPPPR